MLGIAFKRITFRHKFEKTRSTRIRLRAAIFPPGHPDGLRLLVLYGGKCSFFRETGTQITVFHDWQPVLG